MAPMKLGILAFAAVISISCAAAPRESPAAEDANGPGDESDLGTRIVAKVNGQPIYRGFYQHSLTVLRDRLGARENSVEQYLNAKYDALDNLVANELLYQESERQGLTVTESAVWTELERIGRDKGGVEAFLSWMGTYGLTREQSIESIRRRLVVDKYIDETITRNVSVGEGEARSYYEENLERFQRPLSVRVSQILIRCARDASPGRVEERRKRAEEIREMIRSGGVFATLAREYSEDRSAALDGDIGFISKGSSYPELEEVALGLEVGEVGEVVRTDAGFHIVRVTERRGGDVPDFETVEEACERAVLNVKRNERVRAEIERLRESADLESYIN